MKYNSHNNFYILPMNFDHFVEWYKELGKLKIFLAKPTVELKPVLTNNEKCVIGLKWTVRKHVQNAAICIAKDPNKAFEALKDIHEDVTKLIMIPEGDISFSNAINAKSILYFWDINSKLLEGNRAAKVTRLFNWDDAHLRIFRQIHNMSWGFFIPPRENDHIVILAYLNDAPVGMAYLNKTTKHVYFPR